MRSKQYCEAYKKHNKSNSAPSVIEKLIAYEDSIGISFLDWDKENIKEFLRDFRSISPASLHKSLVIIRDFANFITQKEGMEDRKFSLDFNELPELIDYEKLLGIVLNYQQYIHIKNQLKNEFNENIRDVVIFELAWIGLTNNEIKMLKESDIKYKKDEELGWDIAIIHINEEKQFRIDDPEVVEDIKKCAEERYYYIYDRNGISKHMEYKFSEYLIKPISVGRPKKENYIGNPSLTLQSVLNQKGVTCPGIDMSAISIEDVRRSKIIYLLAPENEKFFDFMSINAYFDFGESDSTLYWLKKVAKLKYA